MKILLPLVACALLVLNGCATTVSAVKEGPIHEDQGSRTWGSWMDDQRIETVVAVNIDKANPDLKKSHIVVVSFNGYVLLAGQVPTAELKQEAGSIAKQALKVRKVINELEIAGPTTSLVRSSDTWLTTKIKGRMVAEKEFPSSRVKVITENGIVYLMGLVTSGEADQAVALVRDSYGVQKIVKVFEYIR
ncbi:BON domain-containing protein [Parendozoicomonas haliclonae]|uniref:Osmotically-inducible protein Y n=1 Tax=Parendozoicomonas haliclonae TaxID=1960125 RepID=A0A1X7AER9_9GAMM|nr:BON domain-containing protein [Parendozoicomonas haliclonae]SMA34045.1 Osmotically-inducible protein Y precursor [Parendozoicomonas haliclonae]